MCFVRLDELFRAGPPQILREGLWVGVGQASTVLAGLAGVKLLTTLLPLEVYGQFALLLGLTTLGGGVFCLPTLQASLRFYPEAVRDGKVNALRRLSTRYLLRGWAIVAVLLFAGWAAWSAWKGGGVGAVPVVLAGGFLGADVLRSFEVGLLSAARRQRDFALRSSLDAWARLLGATVAVLVWGASPSSALFGYAAGSALVSLALGRRRVRGSDPGPVGGEDAWAAKNRRAFLGYALPLTPPAVLVWLNSLSDRYILAGVAGVEAAGVYAAGYGLGSQPFAGVNAIVHSTLRPVLYGAVAHGDAVKERRTLRIWLGLVLAVSGVGFALLYLLAEWITRIMLAPEYQSASAVLPWIAAGYALQNVQQTFEIILFAHGQTRRVLALQAIAAIVGVGSYVALIPSFGAVGAAMGTFGTFVVTCAASFFLSGAHRRLGSHRAPLGAASGAPSGSGLEP